MTAKKKKSGIPRNVAAMYIIAQILHLAGIYYFKYSYQYVSVLDFDLFTIGNGLNFLFASILILLYVRVAIKGIPSSPVFRNFMRTYLVVSSLALTAAVVSALWYPSFPKGFLFGQPTSRLLTGGLFLFFQLTQFSWIGFLFLQSEKEYLKTFIKVSIASIVLIVLFLGGTFIYSQLLPVREYQAAISDEPAETAVIFGAAVWSNNQASPALRARVMKGIELFKGGKTKRLQVTGANAPGELSEGEVAYRMLIKNGIPAEMIDKEIQTRSTVEQIGFIKDSLMIKRGFKNIIAISDGYHLFRIREVGRFYGVNIRLAESGLTTELGEMLFYQSREAVSLLMFWLFGLK